jgi:sulfur-oxidizing protein SoxX
VPAPSRALLVALALAAGGAAAQLPPYRVAGDAIPEPLAAGAGDAARGRGIALGRDANCLLCHALPGAAARAGDLGPPLAGVGARLDAGQLRLRVADASRLNPDTLMPPYYRIDGLQRVAEPWRGRPLLNADQVEDVVAYLSTLR